MGEITLIRMARPSISGSSNVAASATTTTGSRPEIRHRRTLFEKQVNVNNNHHHNYFRRIEGVIDTNNDDAERTLESQFIESCVETLTPSQEQQSSNNLEVSQVKFASFVILYCREADGTTGRNNSTSSNNDWMLQQDRGMQCSDTLFFFPDLPRILQLGFVRYTSCYSKNVGSTSTESNDDGNNNNINTIDDCLDDYNAKGELFYMEDTTHVPELCTFTYPLMISTDLLAISSANTSNAPIPTLTPGTKSIPPTIAPIDSAVMTPTPTIAPANMINNASGTDNLSTVGILGITITILFMIMFVYQMVTWKFKKYTSTRSSKKQQRHGNNMAALQEDGSVVASEHSHELGSTPISTIDEDDGESVMDRPTLDRNFDRAARTASTSPSPRRSWLLLRPSTAKPPPSSSTSGQPLTSTPRSSSRSKSPHHHHRFYFNSNTGGTAPNARNNGGSYNNTGNKFTYPKPLAIVTTNLSEDNPVHTRKRFQNPKRPDTSTGHFLFDSATKNRSTTATTAATTISGHNVASLQQPLPSTDRATDSSNNRTQTTSYKSSRTGTPSGTSTSSAQQTYPPQPIIPPPLQQLQQQSGKENTKNSKRTGKSTTPVPLQPHKPFQQKITAITFGDVIHTELRRDTDTTADVPMRIPVRGTSSTILRPQPQP